MTVSLLMMKKGHFVVHPTFQCNIRCGHCLHSCSWERKEIMSIQLFRSCIIQAIEQGWKTICLSGGEPFLAINHIRLASELCHESKIGLVIQTNGFWGKDPARAKEILKDMVGISQIGFSVDKIHLHEIGLDSIIYAISAAIEVGISNISLSVSYQTAQEYQVIKEQFASIPGLYVTGWPILPIGRASNSPELWKDHIVKSWAYLQQNCSAQQQFSPIIHPNGSFHMCYLIVMALEDRDPFLIGNLNNLRLEQLLERNDNRLVAYILKYGAGSLGHLLANSPYEQLLQEKYQSMCHFCYRVLSDSDTVEYLRRQIDKNALF